MVEGRVGVAVLGPLVVSRDGVPIDIGGPKSQTVLLTLVHHVGTVVSVDTLIDALWNDRPPASARNVIQVKISLLRRALGPTFDLRTVPGGYLLDGASVDVDAVAFETRCLRGEELLETDPGAAADETAGALALWRGDPAIGVPNAEPFTSRAVMLHELRTKAQTTLLDARLRLGQHRECCAHAAVLADEHPYREDIRALHLLALYRSGRQTEALRAFRTTRNLLVEELGLEPGPELQALHRRILEQDHDLELPDRAHELERATNASLRRDNLRPQHDEFVERPEVDRVVESLRTLRFVTVVGTGGIGKSRCVAAVALRCRDAPTHPDGVWIVDLAPLPEGTDDIGSTVADAIGLGQQPLVSATQAVISYLAHREALLVLDNCEHVADAARRFADAITAGAPTTSLLAASRVRLGASTETVVMLERLPDDAALRLLTTRIAEIGAGPFPDEDCVDLCSLLDNYPLAIELAAARTSALSVKEIVIRLADRPTLLRSGPARGAAPWSPRHADLSTALDWSLSQLSERTRDTLIRVAVFVSDFDLVSAESILATDAVNAADVVDDLSELVEHHLISRDHGRARFRLLEPIRQYLRVDAPPAVEHRYAQYFAAFAADAAQGLIGPDEAVWWDRFEAELPHVREMIRWASDCGDVELLDPVMARVGTAMVICAFTAPGEWAVDALQRLGGDPAVAPGVALAAASHYTHLDQVDQCDRILDRIGSAFDEPLLRALSLYFWALREPANPIWRERLLEAAVECGDPAFLTYARITLLDPDVVALTEAHGNPTMRVYARQFWSATMPDKLGSVARENKLELYRVALTSNNPHTIAQGQMFMALQHCVDGQARLAGPLAIEMIERTARIRSPQWVWHVVECTANMLAMLRMEPFVSETLWAAVDTASRQPGSRWFRDPMLPPWVAEQLTPDEAREARLEGSRLDPDAASRLALKAAERMAAS